MGEAIKWQIDFLVFTPADELTPTTFDWEKPACKLQLMLEHAGWEPFAVTQNPINGNVTYHLRRSSK